MAVLNEADNIDTFKSFIRGMKKGEKLHYHTGFLFEDRLCDKRLDTMAEAIYTLYQAGAVRLIQTRTGKQSEYYLIRR
jgi:hypothetical protein